MRFRLAALTALSLLCSASCTRMTLDERLAEAPIVLDEGGVRVRAAAWRSGSRWRVEGARAEAERGILRALELSVFEDLDGDGRPGEGEARGGWRTEAPVPGRLLALSGHASEASIGGGSAPLLLRCRVVLDDGSALESTAPLLDR